MSEHPAIELTEGIRIEVHVHSGKGKASMRTYFGTSEIPSEWIAKAVSRNIPEMVELAKAKDAEIKAPSE